MISYVKGPLVAVNEDIIVVETGAVGLDIHVPVSLLPELPGLGEMVTVHTYFQVREDMMKLYGFLHRQDRDMFRQLIGVNGIGPKGALGLLSVLRPDDLRIAIVSEDVKTLAKAPGIGAKTAQRLILDLKDKISVNQVLVNREGGPYDEPGTVPAGAAQGLGEAAKEAVLALMALGYTNTEASKAVKLVEAAEGMTAEDVLKASLKHLSFL